MLGSPNSGHRYQDEFRQVCPFPSCITRLNLIKTLDKFMPAMEARKQNDSMPDTPRPFWQKHCI